MLWVVVVVWVMLMLVVVMCRLWLLVRVSGIRCCSCVFWKVWV